MSADANCTNTEGHPAHHYMKYSEDGILCEGIKEYVRDWRDSLYDDVRCANTKVHTTACVTLVTRELEYGYKRMFNKQRQLSF
ncbi:hypothetical protein ACROYT_G019211 [Oculina patagonica]